MRVTATAFLVWTLVVGAAPPTYAGVMGPDDFYISGAGCRFSNVAYGSVSDKYLAVWVDYTLSPIRVCGRLVTADGQLDGDAFCISDSSSRSFYPAIAYNATDNEFLVAWDDDGRTGSIYGQRVRASDGALLGVNFPIGSVYGGMRCGVAWSSISNCYLVVFSLNNDIWGQRVSNTGALLGGNFVITDGPDWSGHPDVGYCEPGDQFLVAWGHEFTVPNEGYILGRRVSAADGGLLGDVIHITSGGGECRPAVAGDSGNGRWLVQFNELGNPGYSFDQYGQLVGTDGSLVGGVIPIAHTPAFEGETILGSDVAFAPNLSRYLSVFALSAPPNDLGDVGMSAQELNADGSLLGPQILLGTGVYHGHAVAADPGRDRFLAVFDSLEGATYYIRGQLYIIRDPVAAFSAEPGDGCATLSWQNPSDARFAHTMIVYSDDMQPADPSDGIPLVDKPNLPGSSDGHVHNGLSNGVPHYYSAFAYDDQGNYSHPVCVVATPWPTGRMQISASSFTSGLDGWTPNIWRSGSYDYGSMLWSSEAGNPGGGMRSTGAGDSDNDDRCTREGGETYRGIDLTGYKNILVAYDLRAGRLGVDYTGFGVGSCDVDHDLIDEQLTVYYSANAGSSWTEAQWLKRDEFREHYLDYHTREIDLSHITAINNNPYFALRFRWQFNGKFETCDYGDLDNIKVFGDSLSIAEAKALANGKPIALFGKALYYKQGFVGYVEELDRTNGIRIQGSISSAVGETITVTGTMRTTGGGERYILLSSTSPEGSAAVGPLGVTNRSVRLALLDGVYVKIWGVVKPGSITSNSYIITDGSDDAGITVITPTTPDVSEGEFVTIAGAAGIDGERVVYSE